jgi:hypothetical protein
VALVDHGTALQRIIHQAGGQAEAGENALRFLRRSEHGETAAGLDGAGFCTAGLVVIDLVEHGERLLLCGLGRFGNSTPMLTIAVFAVGFNGYRIFSSIIAQPVFQNLSTFKLNRKPATRFVQAGGWRRDRRSEGSMGSVCVHMCPAYIHFTLSLFSFYLLYFTLCTNVYIFHDTACNKANNAYINRAPRYVMWGMR